MAIGPDQQGYTFDPPSIVAHAPHASGVYALYHPRRWVYVGESNDIQRRLLEHFQEVGTCIKLQGATGFQFETVMADTRVPRQNHLIATLTPVCNQRMG